MRTAGLITSLGILASSCLVDFSNSTLGYRCAASADCGPGLVCLEQRCAHPPDAGPRRREHDLWLAQYLGGYQGDTVGLWKDKPPHYRPSDGRYTSTDLATIVRHLEALKYAQFDAALVQWFGDGAGGDRILGLALDAGVSGDSFRWGVLDKTETVSPGPDAGTLRSNLRLLRDRYGNHPNALKLDGGLVVFVDFNAGSGLTACGMATKWMSALRDIDGGLSLALRSTTADYKTCADQPFAWFGDGTMQAVSADVDSIALSPGFWRWDLADAGLPRDPDRFSRDVLAWRDGGFRFHYLTSFNNWADGTQVEGAVEWASDSGYGVYLDTLHATPRAPVD